MCFLLQIRTSLRCQTRSANKERGREKVLGMLNGLFEIVLHFKGAIKGLCGGGVPPKWANRRHNCVTIDGLHIVDSFHIRPVIWTFCEQPIQENSTENNTFKLDILKTQFSRQNYNPVFEMRSEKHHFMLSAMHNLFIAPFFPPFRLVLVTKEKSGSFEGHDLFSPLKLTPNRLC